MAESTARGTLDAARFFVAQAEKELEGDLTAYRYHLEAAIVFGRSVTLHLQKEFAHSPAWEAWYEPQRDAMKADKVAKFFVEQRNFVLKEGRVPLAHRMHVAGFEMVMMMGSVRVVVKRGAPWYRRSPAILWEDATRPLRTWVATRRERRMQQRRAREAAARAAATPQQVRRVIGFVDSPVPDASATELLTRYLDALQPLVDDAEKKFGGGTAA